MAQSDTLDSMEKTIKELQSKESAGYPLLHTLQRPRYGEVLSDVADSLGNRAVNELLIEKGEISPEVGKKYLLFWYLQAQREDLADRTEELKETVGKLLRIPEETTIYDYHEGLTALYIFLLDGTKEQAAAMISHFGDVYPESSAKLVDFKIRERQIETPSELETYFTLASLIAKRVTYLTGQQIKINSEFTRKKDELEQFKRVLFDTGIIQKDKQNIQQEIKSLEKAFSKSYARGKKLQEILQEDYLYFKQNESTKDAVEKITDYMSELQQSFAFVCNDRCAKGKEIIDSLSKLKDKTDSALAKSRNQHTYIPREVKVVLIPTLQYKQIHIPRFSEWFAALKLKQN